MFLIVLEAGKFKTMVLPGLVSGEGLIPGSQMAVFLLCPHVVEGMRDLFVISIIRTLIPFMRTPALIHIFCCMWIEHYLCAGNVQFYHLILKK